MKEKLKLIDEAIKYWKCGEHTDLTALTTIQLIVSPQTTNKQAIKWAEGIIETRDKAILNHTGLCMGKFDDTCYSECLAWEECIKFCKEDL